MKTLHVLRTAGALAVTQIALVSGASAQATAVQWRVEDGGNGHWYQVRIIPDSLGWTSAMDKAAMLGGYLTSAESTAERAFLFSEFSMPNHPDAYVQEAPWSTSIHYGPWIGGRQDEHDPEFSEPLGGWRWVTGSAFNPSELFCCNNFGCAGSENSLHLYWSDAEHRTSWNDLPDTWTCGRMPIAFITEWSADCNADSIVDYGQCLNGTLPDYNSNNIPDCCERGEVCVAGNYPVQWHTSDGGNGHWYQGVATQTAVSWTSARARAVAIGAQLASIASRTEDDFVARLALDNPLVWPTTVGYGPWLGGYQTSPSTNPFANWAWVTGEPWSYVSDVVQFDNSSRPDGQTDDYLHYINHSRVWNDVRNDGDTYYNSIGIRAYMAEWSADCNSDGIVDYGQILTGQLVDMNTNGIPDICEQPPCQDSDITNNHVVDGADLGALLAFWGPVNPVLPQADINRDGVVNGADIGLLLANWGPCGQ
ncbi:MAG: hypothetical protein NT059_06285 [Planctomycetota bacterium]|nr:hypothetical protein [Planctomycetota bacterium]